MTANRNTEVTIKTCGYDPYEHRQPKRPLSNIQALILLTKGAVGVGILSSSLIYKEGYLTGVIYTCMVGALVTYCQHILFRSQYRLCRRLKVPVLGLSESMKKALEYGPLRLRVLHRYAPFIVDSSILLCQFSICTSYALFILQTFGFFQHYTTWNMGLARYIYCLILIAPFILILYMGNWRIVVYVSFAAILASMASFGILFSYLFEYKTPLSSLKMLGDLNQLPNFFGPLLFSLEAISVVTTFEKHLKSPREFVSCWGTLNIGMTLITILNILVGFFGYWRYTEDAVGSFLNDLPLKDPASIVCRSLYTIVIYLSYGLHGYVLIDVLWMKNWRGHGLKFKHFFRIAFVVGSTLLMIFVPFIVRTVILDALYAFSLPILGIVLPALMEFCVEWPSHNSNRTTVLWKDAILILIGLVDTLVGIYFCITQLIQFFSINRTVIFW